MKFRTPLQIHRYRKEKKNLEREIRQTGWKHELTLKEEYRIKLIQLHLDYKYKYFKEYKG